MKTISLVILWLIAMTTPAVAQTTVERQELRDFNVASNPGYENGLTRWTTVGATSALVISGANLGFGGASASFDASATAQTLTGQQVTLAPLLLGKTCKLVVHVKGGDANLIAEAFDGSSAVSGSAVTLATSTNYTAFYSTFTCPTSGTFAPRLRSTADAAIVYVDGWFLGYADVTGQLTNPMDSIGDLIYGGALGVATRLESGTSGQYLRSGGAAAPTWSAVDLATASVTGVLPLANGGSNKNLTAVNGGLLYTDADSHEVSAAGTASQWALSGGAGAPTFSDTTTRAKTVSNTTDSTSGSTGAIITTGGIGAAKQIWSDTIVVGKTGVKFKDTGTGSTTLTNYEETDISVTFDTGAFTGGGARTVTAKLRKIGKLVSVFFPSIIENANADTASMSTSGTPFAAYVTVGHTSACLPSVANVSQIGKCEIDATGKVIISFNANGTTVAGTTSNLGYRELTLSWTE